MKDGSNDVEEDKKRGERLSSSTQVGEVQVLTQYKRTLL